MISKDANGFGGNNRAANILLAATGTAQNEGTELITLDREWVTLKNRLHWGSGAVLVEGVPATIKLPATASHTRCYALNERGNRKAEVPVIAHGSGCRLTIGPHYQTVWYEIEVASNGIR